VKDLLIALAQAMDETRRDLGQDTLRVTQTVVAAIAEHLVKAGWPASLDQQPCPVQPSPLRLLSPREKEVAVLVARGLPNAEVARMLGVSGFTVSSYLRRIFAKLGVNNRTALAAIVLTEPGSGGTGRDDP
jgi:DNA-binding CsgD family transcriptional regulator